MTKLFMRYNDGAGYNRLLESVLTLVLAVDSKDRAKVAVRVCSTRPMPFALATAEASPFRIVEFLVAKHGYAPSQVVYLRSEDCLASEDPAGSITEVWTIPEGGSLPSHVEAYASGEVKLAALGTVEANRGVKDYEAAVQRLISELRNNPSTVGVIFGYYLARPSPALRRRLRDVKKTLEQSGLSGDRYMVRTKAWEDEVSTYPPDTEPKYPSVFVVKIARDIAGK
jgi:hypothetical protein